MQPPPAGGCASTAVTRVQQQRSRGEVQMLVSTSRYVSQAAVRGFTVLCLHPASVLQQRPLVCYLLSPTPLALGTLAVIIGEYSKISHFYLKERTYYK